MDLVDLILWAWTNLLVVPMTNLLVLFSVFSLGNFGIAIILFTIFMRLVTWPVQISQFKSMRAMQEVQPRIQEIQKKHKDPQRRSEETMKLYREAGVNPLGCIWPMLIQFPIWIALYQAIRVTLGSTPESLFTLTSEHLYPFDILRTAVPLDPHFLWMNLGQPDTTFIMAVLTGLTTYVQQKMTTPQTANMDPQQQQMNQTMTIMMPLIFAYMTLQFPSGLALYWVATNVIGIALQYFYMGRRLNWRQLIPLPAPAPTPAAQGGNSASTETAPQADDTREAAEVGAEGTEAGQRRRRRRGAATTAITTATQSKRPARRSMKRLTTLWSTLASSATKSQSRFSPKDAPDSSALEASPLACVSPQPVRPFPRARRSRTHHKSSRTCFV